MMAGSDFVGEISFVDLRSGYYLTGFGDFESAFAASEVLCERGLRISYLNETSHVREMEVRSYVRSFEAADTKQFQNYRFPRTEFAKKSAKESLKTACEVLEEKSACSAKYIVVVAPQKGKLAKLEAVLYPVPAALEVNLRA